jgi:hypothetical protein
MRSNCRRQTHWVALHGAPTDSARSLRYTRARVKMAFRDMPFWMQLLRHIAIWSIRWRWVRGVTQPVLRAMSFFICVK